MGSPAAGALRVARAAAFGAVALALALIAHVAAGGSSPRPIALTFLAGVVAGVSVVVTGRRLCVGATTLALGAVQVGLHAAFMALTPAAGCMTVTMPVSHAGGPMSMTSCPDGAPGWMGLPGSGAALPMVLAHAGATVVLAVLLARGDRALWLLGTLVLPILSLRAAPRLRRRLAPLLGCTVPALGRGRMVSSGVGRRGPPRVRACLT
jgi:hypothetical protein